MRYVMISDMHGEFDKMMVALNGCSFDMSRDTLVVVGDPFDRGSQSKEILDYIMDCPNRILIAGNHDLRLKNLMRGAPTVSTDNHNGVNETMDSFSGERFRPLGLAIFNFKNNDATQPTYHKLMQYFDESVFCAEWDDLIVTHAWVPLNSYWVNKLGNIKKYEVRDDWRSANREDWEDATWTNIALVNYWDIKADKPLLIGHWHANLFHDSNLPFVGDHFTTIDGASNLPDGVVNAFVYESDKAPILYNGKTTI